MKTDDDLDIDTKREIARRKIESDRIKGLSFALDTGWNALMSIPILLALILWRVW